MSRPTLYLLVGYPGSGKTTVSKLLAERTGAIHLWADKERRAMFQKPTHHADESRELYEQLNKRTDKLLAEGKNVIFDTNFNYFKDREHLRGIAATHGADTKVIWLTTPKPIAKQRAVHDRQLRNGYEFVLQEEDFERMSNHLETPHDSEQPIKLDGSDLSEPKIISALGL